MQSSITLSAPHEGAFAVADQPAAKGDDAEARTGALAHVEIGCSVALVAGGGLLSDEVGWHDNRHCFRSEARDSI